jgi:hypothetical protein
MAYKSVVVGNVYLLRWESTDLGDTARIVADVEKGCQNYGAPINYIAIAPSEMEPPSEAARREIMQGLKNHLVRICSRVILVIEDTGFKGAVIRMIGTSMFMFAGERKRVFTSESLENALTRIDDLSVSVEVILSTARARGILR